MPGSTGETAVDEILQDFIQAQQAVEGVGTGTNQSQSVERTDDAGTAELDRVASVLQSADEAHRRLQEQLSMDRE